MDGHPGLLPSRAGGPDRIPPTGRLTVTTPPTGAALKGAGSRLPAHQRISTYTLHGVRTAVVMPYWLTNSSP